jgi:hypothetical protein
VVNLEHNWLIIVKGRDRRGLGGDEKEKKKLQSLSLVSEHCGLKAYLTSLTFNGHDSK